jgi:cobalt-precorrin 5A hydrolase
MGGHAVKVAGFGLRAAATPESLRSALLAAGGPDGLAAIATAADKADHPALQALAKELNLPLLAIPLDRLTAAPAGPAGTPARYAHRSVAEAAALAAAGPAPRLLAPRATSPDRMATCATATSGDP